MTAYGHSQVTTDSGLFQIELHSVNKKGLDVSIQLPRDLLQLDIDFRKILAKKIKRGNISLRLYRQELDSLSLGEHSIDLNFMKKIYKEWQGCANDLGFKSEKAILFSDLLNYTFSKQRARPIDLTDSVRKELEKGLEKAIDGLLDMKVKEGVALVSDIKPRLEIISSDLEAIIQYAEGASKKYYKKLQKRIKEFKPISEEDEERLIRELVIFADRADITEEITRVRSHLAQFYDKLSSKEARLGREFEFIVQEIHREVNTMGAKAQDLEITKKVVAMKSELEKIREQILNIE